MPQSARPNQFALLGQRRFAPFFWTQFGGAGNDNLFKFAFTVMVAYRAEAASALSTGLMVNLIAALYILPFVLFSATSGQLADKYDKAVLMRRVKTLEIAIMALALWGFVTANVPALLACAFGMGLHSTLFGPAKYAYLPQHVNSAELTGANGMTEMGTFVAILLGNLAGGLVMTFERGPLIAGLACVAVALLGWTVARFIPPTAAVD
ncbi:MAG TPA: MFS transporter, partial [Thiomonas arsenitoxydans]|nr:MFS transporter [Thiomonas arsenitoxydans]